MPPQPARKEAPAPFAGSPSQEGPQEDPSTPTAPTHSQPHSASLIPPWRPWPVGFPITALQQNALPRAPRFQQQNRTSVVMRQTLTLCRAAEPGPRARPSRAGVEAAGLGRRSERPGEEMTARPDGAAGSRRCPSPARRAAALTPHRLALWGKKRLSSLMMRFLAVGIQPHIWGENVLLLAVLVNAGHSPFCRALSRKYACSDHP